MSIYELQAALEGLTTDRLQRLADRLESSPGLRVTIGDWRHCPMALAGFDPLVDTDQTPERTFATVWDDYAAPTATITWRDRLSITRRRTASRASVQQLLRLVNATLAYQAIDNDGPRVHRRSPNPDNDHTKHG